VIRIGALERDAKREYFVADNGVGFDMAHAAASSCFPAPASRRDFPGTGLV